MKIKEYRFKKNKWIGVIDAEYLYGLDCIDNYNNPTLNWYDVAEETYSELITKVGQYVDFTDVRSSVKKRSGLLCRL